MPDPPGILSRLPPRPAARAGGSAATRDRSAAYERQRQAIFSGEPLCRYCRAEDRITPATVIDHIIALGLGGTSDPGNLAPAYRACNVRKAVDEAGCIRAGYDAPMVRSDPAIVTWLRLAENIDFE